MASLEAVRRSFRFPLKPLPAMEDAQQEPLASIRSSPLFAGLPEHATVEISACARFRTFARDEALFLQGQPVIALILLHSGSVKHTQVGPSGTEVLIRFSVNGEIVDLQSESPGLGHSCSARATENCRALVWDYGRIEHSPCAFPSSQTTSVTF